MRRASRRISSPAMTSASLLARASRLPARTAAHAERSPSAPTRPPTATSASGWAATSSSPASPQTTRVPAPGGRRRERRDTSSGLATETTLGRCRAACSASLSMDRPAARATTRNRSGNASATRRAEHPMDPVDPSTARPFMAKQKCYIAAGMGEWPRSASRRCLRSSTRQFWSHCRQGGRARDRHAQYQESRAGGGRRARNRPAETPRRPGEDRGGRHERDDQGNRGGQSGHPSEVGGDGARGDEEPGEVGGGPSDRGRDVRVRGGQKEQVRGGESGRGEEQAPREGARQGIGNRQGGKEEDREQVPAPQTPSAFPARVRRDGEKEGRARGQNEETVPPVGSGAPPADPAPRRPEKKRRERQDAARGMEEQPCGDPGARKTHSEEAAPGDLGEVRGRLPGGGEHPRRTETGGVVEKEQGQRGGRLPPRRRRSAAAHPAIPARTARTTATGATVYSEMEAQPASSPAADEQSPARIAARAFLALADQLPGQIQEGRGPGVAEEGPRVVEKRCAERHRERDRGEGWPPPPGERASRLVSRPMAATETRETVRRRTRMKIGAVPASGADANTRRSR